MAEIKEQVTHILETYTADTPAPSAEALRALWLQFQPKSIAGISVEQRKKQETVGIPVPVLKSIGKEIAKVAQKRVEDFIPLMTLLWDEYGREGRVVALIPLGKMELKAPESIIPLLDTLCRSCITWEDADRLAMDALEPIVRKSPEDWLPVIEPWLADENKWVRRAGITVVARLPMKHPDLTQRCLSLAEGMLEDEETDVKRAVSFAIRLAARGDPVPVRDFLARNVPPQSRTATWVLCDAIRSMTKKLLPTFVPLLPRYEQWLGAPDVSTRDRRSIESAIKTLKRAQS